MTVPEVYWSESAGLLRVVGSEIRGPRGVLDQVPDDAVRLVPAVEDQACKVVEYMEVPETFWADRVPMPCTCLAVGVDHWTDQCSPGPWR